MSRIRIDVSDKTDKQTIILQTNETLEQVVDRVLEGDPEPDFQGSTHKMLEALEATIIVPVDSSFIKNIGYSFENDTLLVDFDHGGRTKYVAPPAEFWDFINADSKGEFYNQYIKGIYETA